MNKGTLNEYRAPQAKAAEARRAANYNRPGTDAPKIETAAVDDPVKRHVFASLETAAKAEAELKKL